MEVRNNIQKLKLITGGIEAVLAIPIVGLVITWASFFIIPFLLMSTHIVTLVLAYKHGERMEGSFIGVVAAGLGTVPILSFLTHGTAAVFLINSASDKDLIDKDKYNKDQ